MIQSTSAQERLLAPAVVAEVEVSGSIEDSWEDSDAPVLRSSLEEHRIVDVEPKVAKTKETPEERLARWKTEIFGGAAPFPAEPGSEGVSKEATGEKEKPSDVVRQQAEDKFEQTPGLSHGCRQSLALLQGPGKGPATKINGLFYWNADDSLILH